MHATEQPAEAERDDHSRIRLCLDSMAQRPLKRTSSLSRRRGRSIGDLGGAVARLAVKILRGILHFAGHIAGLLLGVTKGAVEVRIRVTALCHGNSPLGRGRQTTQNMAESSMGRNVCHVPVLSREPLTKRDWMDEPKRPEPEIVQPVPKTEPRRESVEVPPDKDAPEKPTPTSAEGR
jgi:hypothetical protein